MELLIFALLALGLVYLITQSAIAYLPRNAIADLGAFWESLIYCPACTGFWVGVLLGALGYWVHAGWLGVIEAGVSACALGALWSVYGPPSPWARERVTTEVEMDDDTE